jgi:hypothetical protein
MHTDSGGKRDRERDIQNEATSPATLPLLWPRLPPSESLVLPARTTLQEIPRALLDAFYIPTTQVELRSSAQSLGGSWQGTTLPDRPLLFRLHL